MIAGVMALGCASTTEPGPQPPPAGEATQTHEAEQGPAQQDEDLDTLDRDEVAAANAGEVITFDGMDAEPAEPDMVRAAPKRKPIGRFKLFGEGASPPR